MASMKHGWDKSSINEGLGKKEISGMSVVNLFEKKSSERVGLTTFSFKERFTFNLSN